jgi:putative endonuclease
MKEGFVYILGNSTRTVLYTGVTSDLIARVYQHKHENGSKFTSKYNCHYLLGFEYFESIEDAIIREKQIKKWKKAWKLKWIYSQNQTFKDLYKDLINGCLEYNANRLTIEHIRKFDKKFE